MWKRRLGAVSATFILAVALLAPSAMAIGVEAEDLGISVNLRQVVRQVLGNLWAWIGFWSHETSDEFADDVVSFHGLAAIEPFFHGDDSETEGDPPSIGCYADPNG